VTVAVDVSKECGVARRKEGVGGKEKKGVRAGLCVGGGEGYEIVARVVLPQNNSR
jgi:hypothetical protein